MPGTNTHLHSSNAYLAAEINVPNLELFPLSEPDMYL